MGAQNEKHLTSACYLAQGMETALNITIDFGPLRFLSNFTQLHNHDLIIYSPT